MSSLAGLLKLRGLSPSGIFDYGFFSGGDVYHVTSRHLESMGVGLIFDFTLWLLLLIIMVNLMSPLFREKREGLARAPVR